MALWGWRRWRGGRLEVLEHYSEIFHYLRKPQIRFVGEGVEWRSGNSGEKKLDWNTVRVNWGIYFRRGREVPWLQRSDFGFLQLAFNSNNKRKIFIYATKVLDASALRLR
jgi:hypothetical protein